jgi:hypothetical protein
VALEAEIIALVVKEVGLPLLDALLTHHGEEEVAARLAAWRAARLAAEQRANTIIGPRPSPTNANQPGEWVSPGYYDGDWWA